MVGIVSCQLVSSVVYFVIRGSRMVHATVQTPTAIVFNDKREDYRKSLLCIVYQSCSRLCVHVVGSVLTDELGSPVCVLG